MKKSIIFGASVLILVLISRFAIHIPNFSIIGALVLFSGAFFKTSYKAFLIPMIALLCSDMILAFTLKGTYLSYITSFGFVANYAAYLLGIYLGTKLNTDSKTSKIALYSILSSIGFFIISNFIAWKTCGFYEQSMKGLATCYTAGLMFYQNNWMSNFFLNQIVADLFFGILIFKSYQYIKSIQFQKSIA